jgi:hypothetical protein
MEKSAEAIDGKGVRGAPLRAKSAELDETKEVRCEERLHVERCKV